jgi:hypothetical protein
MENQKPIKSAATKTVYALYCTVLTRASYQTLHGVLMVKDEPVRKQSSPGDDAVHWRMWGRWMKKKEIWKGTSERRNARYD